MIIGYTTGVFDLFHIGHLNIIRNAKALCDRLIVGVSTTELVFLHKKKRPIIPFDERCEILRNIKYVDTVIPQETMDKFKMWQKLKFDILVVGDDWYDTVEWKKTQMQFDNVGVKIVYYPYTKSTSTSLINDILEERRK